VDVSVFFEASVTTQKNIWSYKSGSQLANSMHYFWHLGKYFIHSTAIMMMMMMMMMMTTTTTTTVTTATVQFLFI
jgi:hypothetical protein